MLRVPFANELNSVDNSLNSVTLFYMPKVFYEFQFTRKNLPYYVDVHAETVTEALTKANTIDHDFVLVPAIGSKT